MKTYVDCTSGYSHLIGLSNARFTLLNRDLEVSEKDETMRVLRLFEQCYFDGAVSSQCGRRVIDSSILLKNITKTFSKLKTNIDRHVMVHIMEAALRGMYDNCAGFGDSSAYFPKGTK